MLIRGYGWLAFKLMVFFCLLGKGAYKVYLLQPTKNQLAIHWWGPTQSLGNNGLQCLVALLQNFQGGGSMPT